MHMMRLKLASAIDIDLLRSREWVKCRERIRIYGTTGDLVYITNQQQPLESSSIFNVILPGHYSWAFISQFSRSFSLRPFIKNLLWCEVDSLMHFTHSVDVEFSTSITSSTANGRNGYVQILCTHLRLHHCSIILKRSVSPNEKSRKEHIVADWTSEWENEWISISRWTVWRRSQTLVKTTCCFCIAFF